MKKYLYILVAVVATLALAACGGSKGKDKDGNLKLTVADTHISGPLGEYFTLVDKPYLYKTDWSKDEVTVELECIKPLPEDKKAYIGCVVEDADGLTIINSPADHDSFNDYSLLRTATPGEKITVTVKNHYNKLEDNTGAQKLRLTSQIEDEEPDTPAPVVSSSVVEETKEASSSTEASTEASTSVSSSSSGENWDEILDEYEAYVDKLASIYKKIKAGDMSAYSEYAGLMSSAESLSSKLSEAKGTMTSSQWSRYNKILRKMTSAMQ